MEKIQLIYIVSHKEYIQYKCNANKLIKNEYLFIKSIDLNNVLCKVKRSYFSTNFMITEYTLTQIPTDYFGISESLEYNKN